VSAPLRPAERAYTLSTRQGWNEYVSGPARQRPDALTSPQFRALPEAARDEHEERRSVWHANLGPLRTPQMRAVHEQLDDIVEANRQDGDKVKGAAVIDAYLASASPPSRRSSPANTTSGRSASTGRPPGPGTTGCR
jgi:hypothetical protein